MCNYNAEGNLGIDEENTHTGGETFTCMEGNKMFAKPETGDKKYSHVCTVSKLLQDIMN